MGKEIFEFVDIEATSHCNSRCAFCNRSYLDFKPKNLDIEIIKKLPFERIKKVMFLGSKGDAIFYPHILEIVEWITKNYGSIINIHTNASIHSPLWWERLAKSFRDRGHVIYALDGLEDTHSLYRNGTNFYNVIENIKAFNKAGGRSVAQFIRFKHNAHQVDDVRNLAREMGSIKFWLRKSRGYNSVFQRPDDARTRHEIGETKDSRIVCTFLENGSFILTVDGEIRPCCFMADDDYVKDFMSLFYQDIRNARHIAAYRNDPKSINLKYHDLESIFASPYFQEIKKSYEKLHRCNQKCKAQFCDIVDEDYLL
jgi:MoaA/NifB/PqqE/SkfB family radical SAM enzyme